MHFSEQVANDGVSVAGQIFRVSRGFTAHDFCLLRQDDAELAQQTTDAVDRCGALDHEALPSAVHHQLRLLLFGLHWHESPGGSLHGLADCRCVLATLAAHAVRRHQLGRHQLHGVAVPGEQTCPVMGTRTRLHADHARRKRGDQFVQLGACHARAHRHWIAVLIPPRGPPRRSWRDRYQRRQWPWASPLEQVDGETDASPSWHFDVACRKRSTGTRRLARDGVVPFIQ